MSKMHEIEIERYQREIIDDVRSLIEKYRRIMEWDIPENVEAESDRAIFSAVREALDRIERELVA